MDLSLYVDPKIDNAQTLPVKAFLDQELLDEEIETIFSSTWLCLPKNLIPDIISINRDAAKPRPLVPGKEKETLILGESIFFKRDDKPIGNPTLRCFLNRCPHAFYPLLLEQTDERRSRTITCGQHGLKTGCDGHFISHPAYDNPDEETRKSLSLTEYVFKEWRDFYFICRGSPIASLDEFLGEVDESFSFMPLDQFRYAHNKDEKRVVNNNWKLHAWNYMDKLHISGGIHNGPNGLQDATDMRSYKTELHRFSALQWVYAANPEDGFEQEHLPPRFRNAENPDKRVFALWWYIFPNIALNFYPWGLSVNIWMPIPDDPKHTEFLWFHYVFDEEKYKERDVRWLSSQVDNEDMQAMTQVAKNISRTQRNFRGRFGPKGEQGPHWFHNLVWELGYKNK